MSVSRPSGSWILLTLLLVSAAAGGGFLLGQHRDEEQDTVRTLVTQRCADVLDDFFKQMHGRDLPRLIIRPFSFVPMEWDQFVGYAEIYPSSKDWRIADIVRATFSRCSSTSSTTIDLDDPFFGELLLLELQGSRMEHTFVRLNGNQLVIYGLRLDDGLPTRSSGIQ